MNSQWGKKLIELLSNQPAECYHPGVKEIEPTGFLLFDLDKAPLLPHIVKAFEGPGSISIVIPPPEELKAKGHQDGRVQIRVRPVTTGSSTLKMLAIEVPQKMMENDFMKMIYFTMVFPSIVATSKSQAAGFVVGQDANTIDDAEADAMAALGIDQRTMPGVQELIALMAVDVDENTEYKGYAFKRTDTGDIDFANLTEDSGNLPPSFNPDGPIIGPLLEALGGDDSNYKVVRGPFTD